MKITTLSEYDKQANDFLTKTNTTFSVKFLKYDFYFDDVDEQRDIYEITLQRKDRKYVFTFGQSIFHSGKYSYFLPSKGRKFVSNDKKQLQKLVGKTLTNGEIVINDKQQEPSAYDVFASLQKYDVGTLRDFCSEFGYDEDSRKAEKTYNLVLKEFENIKMLYTDEEIAEIREIN